MSKTQSTLFPTEPDVKPLRCPGCGYCPAELDIPLTPMNFACDHELDYFDCAGADEGNLLCTQCSCEFSMEDADA